MYRGPMISVSASDRDTIYKLAFSRQIEKSAQASQSAKPGSGGTPSKGKDALIGSLVGLLLGGGLGAVNNAITPRDKDESRSKRFWRHLLGGMALGGIAGAGVGYLGIPRATASAAKDMVAGKTGNGKGEWETGLGYVGDSPVGRAAIGYGAGYTAGKAAPLAFEWSRLGGTGYGAQSRINIKGFDRAGNVVNLNPGAAPDKSLGTYFSSASSKDAAKILDNIKSPNGVWRPVGILSKLSPAQVKNMTDAEVTTLAQSIGLIPGPGAAITGRSIPPSWFAEHLPSGLVRRLGLRTTWKYVTGIDDARTAILKAIPKAKTITRIAGNLSRTNGAAGFRAGVVKYAPRTLGVIGALIGALLPPGASDPNAVTIQ